jgi:hypothetical protein
VDLDVGRSGPTCMKALARGVGVACDGKGNIFLADRVAGRVLKVQRSDAQVVWAMSCPCPLGIAYDAEMDTVFVVARAENCVHALRACDGRVQEQWGDTSDACNLCLPSGLAVHGDLICVAETGRDRLAVFRKEDGSFLRYIEVQGKPRGVAFMPGGASLVVGLRNMTHALAIVDARGITSVDGDDTFAPTPDLRGTLSVLHYPSSMHSCGISLLDLKAFGNWKPDSIAVDPQQELILVCDVTTGAVYSWRFDSLLGEHDRCRLASFCGTVGGDPVIPQELVPAVVRAVHVRRDRDKAADDDESTRAPALHHTGALEDAGGSGGGSSGHLAASGASVHVTSRVAAVAVDPLSGRTLLARCIWHHSAVAPP